MAEGDFNLMCYPKHRNEDGGNINEILGFNNAISRLSLVEIPLKGCKYTWTNCQPSPLLERLEWFFLSNSWIIAFPNTVASTLSRDTADHTPCLISATTRVPRAQIFRFENYLLEHPSFNLIMQHGWDLHVTPTNEARALGAKFKNLRRL